MPVRTPDRIRVVRRIDLLHGVEVQVTDSIGGWFSGEIVPPNEDSSPLDPGPTRDREPHLARWPTSTFGPGALAPGRGAERIESGSLTYELLGVPRELRSGRRAVGTEVAVMPLGDLYPEGAEIQEQDGTPVADVTVALWEDSSSRSDEGMYHTYLGEAPIEFADEFVVKNRQLQVNDVAFRIIDPVVFFEVPRVRFSLRGPR